jgi:hypothetical protein
MAREFDGVDDLIGDFLVGTAAIDNALSTWCYWIYVDATPSTKLTTVGEQTSTAFRQQCAIDAPVTAGFTTRFFQDTNDTSGQWRSPDITLNAWHHIAITYDRGSLTNDPVIYVDGSSVTVTEVSTPTMMIQSGEVRVRIGEDAANASDFDGRLAECAIWNVLLTADEIASLARGTNPTLIRTTALEVYIPLDGNASPETEWVVGTTGTVTGAVYVEHPPKAMGVFDWPEGWLGAFMAAVAGGQTITPTAIASGEAFGTATLHQQVRPSAIGSVEAFGATLLRLTITSTGLASAEAVGTPTLNLVLRLAGIVSLEAFGAVALHQQIRPGGIVTAEQFGTPIVSTGGLFIVPAGLASAEAFGTLRVNQQLRAVAIASAEAFGALRVTQDIRPTGIGTAEALGAPRLGFVLQPGGLASAEAFGVPLVLPGAVLLVPTGIASAEVFGSVVVILVGAQEPLRLFTAGQRLFVLDAQNRLYEIPATTRT